MAATMRRLDETKARAPSTGSMALWGIRPDPLTSGGGMNTTAVPETRSD
jgi:hypothetical protein